MWTTTCHIASYSADKCKLVADKSQGYINRVETIPSSTVAEPVIGYPVGLAPSMAYYTTEPPYENLSNSPHQQGLSSNYVPFASTSHSSENLPQPSQPAGAVPYYPSSSQFTPSPYVQAPWSSSVPFTEQRNIRRSRGKIALALVGGAISGLLLGDILGAVFWWKFWGAVNDPGCNIVCGWRNLWFCFACADHFTALEQAVGG